MSKTLSLTNSRDIIANSIGLIQGNKIVDITELFLTKEASITNIIGISPEQLNTIAELAAAINNDSNYFGTIQNLLSLKATISYVDSELQKKSDWTEILTKNQIYTLLNLKSDKNSSYTIEDINNLFFNKTQIDEKLNLKANWVDVYTHNQINTLLLLN